MDIISELDSIRAKENPKNLKTMPPIGQAIEYASLLNDDNDLDKMLAYLKDDTSFDIYASSDGDFLEMATSILSIAKSL